VTPYDDAFHIGHAMVSASRCSALLEHQHAVRHVRNFTDIDDKIIDRAAERGEDALTLPAVTATATTRTCNPGRAAAPPCRA
jgi:cysteinyl-tRNA synthetase